MISITWDSGGLLRETYWENQSAKNPEYPCTFRLDVTRIQGLDYSSCKHFSGLYVQQATLRGEILFSHRKRAFLLFTVKKVNLPSSPISLLYCNPLHVQAPIVDPLPHSCGSWGTSGTAGNMKLLLLLLSWIMKTIVSHLSVFCLLQHPWNSNKLTC